ncbi:hypothetical protein TruAng_005146 [Truncatella angustata]|nr:hypothetical protein TruAng_005146 [Truncatella angustata]
MASKLFTASQEPPRSSPPSELEKWRVKLGNHFESAVSLIKAIRRPIADHTDGGKPLDPKEESYWQKKLESTIGDLGHLGITDVKTLIEMSTKVKNGDMVDDKQYLMEGLIKAAAQLPQASMTGNDITSNFLTTLWNDLEHPPQSTDHDDYQLSQTSSYLDLSPLYGANETEQKTVRTYRDGRIHPDCFADKRMLGFPPGVAVLLIMFNRHHNYVVENLAQINENGRFTPPIRDNPKYRRYLHPSYQRPENKHKIRTYELDLLKYDEDLFQTARLITCGLYVNIILVDYVRTILNLNRTESKWQLNPRMPLKGVPMGGGNQVSAEFNLVYRWHSAISTKDEEWTNNMWRKLFPDVEDVTQLTEGQFLHRLVDYNTKLGDDPMNWPIADGLARDPVSRKLADDDLVNIMTACIEDPANSFGANRVPVMMRAIEILGMKQARAWGVATLNEFRRYFQLEPHREFTDINPDPEVADQLRHLYGHPDLVEMYPGLVAEAAKEPKLPGSGLCPSFTVSRAVLADAVALVRGDRFYTTDYHPKKLTNWGYAAASFDLDIDNGCVFYKLFARAFPDHFEANSVYAHYPMTVPKYMKTALQDLGKERLYSYEQPKLMSRPKMIFSHEAAEKVLGDKLIFRVMWGEAMQSFMSQQSNALVLAGHGFGDDQSRERLTDALYVAGWEADVRKFYEKTTMDLLKEKSHKLAGKNQVDIIRDVGNLAHVRFAAEMFMLPLKGKDRPGIFDEHQLYTVLTAVLVSIYHDFDPATSFGLHQKAQQATQVLGQLIEANIKEVKMGGYLSGLAQLIWPKETTLQRYGKPLIERLLANKDLDIKTVVWDDVLGFVCSMVPNQGHLFGQMIDYFISKDGVMHLPEVNRLARSDVPEDFDTLMHYVLEASRLSGETGALREVVQDITIQDKGRSLDFKAGDRVTLNLRAASHDPKKFPNPTELRLDRPLESYIHLGYGPHASLSQPIARVALTSMLKVIGQLDGLKPVPGPQGRIQKRMQPFPEGTSPPGPGSIWPGQGHVWRDEDVSYHLYLTEMSDSYFPFSTSLKVMWDSDAKDSEWVKVDERPETAVE